MADIGLQFSLQLGLMTLSLCIHLRDRLGSVLEIQYKASFGSVYSQHGAVFVGNLGQMLHMRDEIDDV